MIDADNLPRKRIRNPGRRAMAKLCAGRIAPSTGVRVNEQGRKVTWSRTAWRDEFGKMRSRLTEKPYDG